jgi:hypothetical protein
MEQIIKKIIKKIELNKEDKPFFDNNYKTFKLTKQNFHDIFKKKTDKNVIFIDGGNSEIFKSPGISLFFNRIYYTVYKNNKRVKNKKFEFFSLITCSNKEDKLVFKTELFQNDFDFPELEFDSEDKTLKQGNNLVRISKIGDVLRRFAEIKISSLLNIKDSVIVLDGTLEPKYTYEDGFIEELFNKDMIITGLAKTCSLLTQRGDSLISKLKKISTLKTWYYYPVAFPNKKNHLADIYFVKLNKNSDYVFRFEVYNKKDYDINEILFLLKQNSKDPVFLGYPYGLIEADKFARISNKETESLKLKLRIKFGKNIKKVENYLDNLNAHEILDNIG